MIEINGEKFKLLGWAKENNITRYVILKEGNIKPHLLMVHDDKCKLFGPLGNSLPGTNIELKPILEKLKVNNIGV